MLDFEEDYVVATNFAPPPIVVNVCIAVFTNKFY